MRHLRSLSYAVVLAPTTWTLSAVAFTQELTGRARTEGSIEVLTGFLLLLLAGAAYAILLLPRFSPVGPIATGVVFLAVCVWVIIDAASFDSLFPAGVRKPGFDLTLPAHGLAALLAVPLLCTALSRRRWRESRFDPVDAHTGTIIWPFARPARPGTLVVPGVTGVPTSDATQVLHLGEPADRTQVVGDLSPSAGTRPVPPPGDATQVIPPPAEATRALPPAADLTQPLPPADATQALPPAGAPAQASSSADLTQALAPSGDATQVLPPLGGAGAGVSAEAGPGGPLPADEAADTQLVAPAVAPADATPPADSGPSASTSASASASASEAQGAVAAPPTGAREQDAVDPSAVAPQEPETPRDPGRQPVDLPVGAGATTSGSERPADEAAGDTTRRSEPQPTSPPPPRQKIPDNTEVTRNP